MSYARLLRTMWQCSYTSTPARRVAEFSAKALLLPFARMCGHWNPQVTRIGITGSAGKTTTKNLIHAVLAAKWKGTASHGTHNRSRMILRSMFRFQSGECYRIQELGAFGPGTLDELLYAFQPDMGVVTNIGLDHYAAFRTREAVADEKSKLVKSLPSDGLAVLNADEPLVVAMRAHAPGRAILAGRHASADLKADEVNSVWPDPLSFVAVCREGRVRVRTRLHGEQWVFPVLAAIAVGRMLEVPMVDILRAVAACRPEPGRMSSSRTRNGVHWVCDDWKAPVWSYPSVLTFLERARAKRKVLVLGQFSDSPLKPRRLYARLARQGRAVADHVCLIGKHAHHGLRARESEDDTSIVAFREVADAAHFLGGFLRRGDLVLVKATASRDGRLSNVILSGREVLPPSD